jgi:hypothetical protein
VDTDEDFSDLRRAEANGRPLGASEFVTGLEKLLGREIACRAPSRRPTADVPAAEQLELLVPQLADYQGASSASSNAATCPLPCRAIHVSSSKHRSLGKLCFNSGK